MTSQRIDLKLVDEGYTAQDGGDKGKAAIAAAIREGRRRQRDAQQAEVERLQLQHDAKTRGIYEAHEGEMKRQGKLIAKAAWRDGALVALPFGIGLAAALIASTYWVMKDVVVTNITTRRVEQSLDAGPVPSLSDGYREAEQAGRP